MSVVPDSLIIKVIADQIAQSASSLKFESVSGGSINNCYRISTTTQQSFFLKFNHLNRYPGMLSSEAGGLELLTRSGIRTPKVVSQFNDEHYQYLLLEWINYDIKTIQFWKKFGQQLAQLHSHHTDMFGAVPDNYIGSLPQSNLSAPTWSNFFIEQRLKPQIKLSLSKDLLPENYLNLFDQLFNKLPQLFPDEKPSLVHGDLWSGNFLCDNESNPVLIDPAVYYGHRLMDIAMTQLFGGFDRAFYEAYHYHFPLPSNYDEQTSICQLYPLLVHLNLFGHSYLNDINSILKRYSGY